MASPQLENGYTRIANEILEHLSMPGMSGSELRIIVFILRKTYGFGKKKDKIPLSQFSRGTGMNRPQVIRTLKKAVSKRILLKDKNTYGINKNWEQWVVSKRIHSIQKDTGVVSKRIPKVVSKRIHSKEKKETNTKENTAAKPQEWNFKEYTNILLGDKQRHIRIIGKYFKYRGISFQSKQEAGVAIKRHCRAAKDLSVFQDEKLRWGFETAVAQYPELWTLETVIKLLTK